MVKGTLSETVQMEANFGLEKKKTSATVLNLPDDTLDKYLSHFSSNFPSITKNASLSRSHSNSRFHETKKIVPNLSKDIEERVGGDDCDDDSGGEEDNKRERLSINIKNLHNSHIPAPCKTSRSYQMNRPEKILPTFRSFTTKPKQDVKNGSSDHRSNFNSQDNRAPLSMIHPCHQNHEFSLKKEYNTTNLSGSSLKLLSPATSQDQFTNEASFGSLRKHIHAAKPLSKLNINLSVKSGLDTLKILNGDLEKKENTASPHLSISNTQNISQTIRVKTPRRRSTLFMRANSVRKPQSILVHENSSKKNRSPQKSVRFSLDDTVFCITKHLPSSPFPRNAPKDEEVDNSSIDDEVCKSEAFKGNTSTGRLTSFSAPPHSLKDVETKMNQYNNRGRTMEIRPITLQIPIEP